MKNFIKATHTIHSDGLLNLNTLSVQLDQISESFLAFGAVAGVSPTALIEVAAKSSNFHDSMIEICDLWLKKCQHEETPPTWHAVARILHIIGHTELSKDFMKVYKTGMTVCVFSLDNSLM